MLGNTRLACPQLSSHPPLLPSSPLSSRRRLLLPCYGHLTWVPMEGEWRAGRRCIMLTRCAAKKISSSYYPSYITEMHHLFHPLPWVHPSHPSILNLHPCQTSKGLLSELYPLSKAKMIWIEARLRQEANSPNKLFFQIEATSDLNKLNQSPYCLYCSDFLVHQLSVTNLFLRDTLDQICEKEKEGYTAKYGQSPRAQAKFFCTSLESQYGHYII